MRDTSKRILTVLIDSVRSLIVHRYANVGSSNLLELVCLCARVRVPTKRKASILIVPLRFLLPLLMYQVPEFG